MLELIPSSIIPRLTTSNSMLEGGGGGGKEEVRCARVGKAPFVLATLQSRSGSKNGK